MSAPGRLRVGIVGAGRVGAVLAAALMRAGHTVTAVSGASDETVTRIEALLPGVPILEPQQVLDRADLVLLTVPDDHIEPVAAGLAALGSWRTGQIALHCSGRLGTEALAAASAQGVVALAVHPAMTFTGTSLDVARLGGTCFAVSAAPGVLPIAQALVVEMGGEPVVIADADRPAYHAAMVHAGNHVATAVSQSAALLSRIGVEEPGRVLGPLVHASADGALADAPGSVASLTGPVVRADAGTIAAHARALPVATDLGDAYRAMARATADLALAGGRIGAGDHAAIIAALEGES